MQTGEVSKSRNLIVNADDFGLSDETNRGIIHARRHGILTSVSLMVLRPAAGTAAEYARRDPQLSVGLHVELGEWSFRDSQWRSVRADVNPHNASSVEIELRRQLSLFEQLLGRPPTHLDSHQHVHMNADIRPVFEKLADELRIVLRSCSAEVQYCGSFFGTDENMAPRPDFVSTANLIHLIKQIPVGITELGMHPGFDTVLESEYRDARLAEVQALCDPLVKQAVAGAGITLTSFAEIIACRTGCG